MLTHFMAVSWRVFCIFLSLLYSKTQKGIIRGHCWTCVVERTENCDGRNPSPEKCLFCSSFYCNPRKPEFPSYPWVALSLPEPCCSCSPALCMPLSAAVLGCAKAPNGVSRDTNPPGDTGSHMLVKSSASLCNVSNKTFYFNNMGRSDLNLKTV